MIIGFLIGVIIMGTLATSVDIINDGVRWDRIANVSMIVIPICMLIGASL